MEQVLREECPDVSVTLSHRLSREYREYERTSTAVIDAYVNRFTTTYLETLEGNLQQGDFGGHFLLTRSGRRDDRGVREGPTGAPRAVRAGRRRDRRCGSREDPRSRQPDHDRHGRHEPRCVAHRRRARQDRDRAAVRDTSRFDPTIDIHTIGAGGGSIAWVDEGGHLQVGPRAPAPSRACLLRKGRDQATFTDAALAVGYLDPNNFLGGEIRSMRS